MVPRGLRTNSVINELLDAWAKIYEEMKYRYKMSLLIGLFGYILLFNSSNDKI